MPQDGLLDQRTRNGNGHAKRKTLKFGLINLSTLRGKEEEVIMLMKERSLDLVGLSDTRSTGECTKLLHDNLQITIVQVGRQNMVWVSL